MFSTTTGSSRHTKDGGHRKTMSGTTTSTSIALPGTPLRAHNGNTSHATMTTTKSADTSFLPELYSTPPMPSFQKPLPAGAPSAESSPFTPKATGLDQDATKQNLLPRPSPHRKPVPITKDAVEVPRTSPRPLAEDTDVILAPSSRTIANNAGEASKTTVRVPRKLSRLYTKPRIPAAGPLPKGWSTEHDRTICSFDVRGFSLNAIVTKVKRSFPELNGTLTTGMVDKRLLQLDDNIDIDYWQCELLVMMDDIPEVQEPKVSPLLMDDIPEVQEPKGKPLGQTNSVTNLLTDENLIPAASVAKDVYRPRRW